MFKKYKKKLKGYKKKITESPTYLELKTGTKKTYRDIKGSDVYGRKKRKTSKLDKKLIRIGKFLGREYEKEKIY